MSYYPILSAPGAHGWTTLSNFAPNNWEPSRLQDQFVSVTWASDNLWLSKRLAILSSDAFYTVHAREIADIVPNGSLALLSLSASTLPEESMLLPTLDLSRTYTPQWRATLGLSTDRAQTSYQGELDFFPPQGSLLTFGPFLQFGDCLQNFLLLINIEISPSRRFGELEVYTSDRLSLRGQFQMSNNNVNCIPLDSLDFYQDDLPLFLCRNMSAIPLFFSCSTSGSYLSLEHTHPPASLVVHGKRWEAQKLLKNRWFEKAHR